jgi:hypothetical protein
MSDNVLLPTISSFIFDSIRKRVIEGDLKPGQALREQESCDFYGTSSAPIRETASKQWCDFRSQVTDNFRIISEQNLRVLE